MRWSTLGLLLLVFLFPLHVVNAATVIDTDGDGLSDVDEMNLYFTDFLKVDTDGDGFPDGQEIAHGYSPLVPQGKRLTDTDLDQDGLSDALELAFKSNLSLPDTDGDGITDGKEIEQGTSPVSKSKALLPKTIEVHLKDQRLYYSLGGVRLGEMKVSTGKPSTPTLIGTFSIQNKDPKAWSRPAKLWMPYWMAFVPSGRFGIHELPEWPNGKKEGEDHLGTPVSGGCVRVGVGSAKWLYDWTPVGTKVTISKT